jgi:replicative DNA helicase
VNPGEANFTAEEQAAFDRVIATFGPDITVGPFEPLDPDDRPDAILPEEPTLPPQIVDGLTFVLGGSTEEPPVWGRGDEVAWSHGEPLGLVGPDGTGKTTLGQQIELGLLGVRPKVLGMHIEPADGIVLYVSADRPQQAQRSMWRMVKDLDKSAFGKLKTGLYVWRGLLPFDLVKDPAKLAEFAADYGASHVILDSLGMIVPRLTEDETGSALAQSFTVCSVAGIEVLWLLHPRKATGENRKPNTLADVYGSRWITAATGSVLSLWGNAGDPVIEVKHLKPPKAEFGPFVMAIDHASGEVSVLEGTDLLGQLRAAANGLSAKEAGGFMDGANDKARAEKARRKLERLVERGLAYRRSGDTIRGAVTEPDRYFATPPKSVREAPG